MSIMFISILGNSAIFYTFEQDTWADLSIWDSFWYSLISITTIGYGDFYPESPVGRISATFFILVIGLGTFTTTLGMIIDWIADFRNKERKGMGKIRLRNHLVIVNFPDELRIQQIIREYRSDPAHNKSEIVIIADQIEELPLMAEDISFVRGWPLEKDTFIRANIEDASQAIVLSPNHLDQRSDSLVASICFVMHSINPDLDVVAECLDMKHSVLFNSSKKLKLVYTLEIANNLLVQEAQDPGVTRLTHAITSNDIDGTLASTEITSINQNNSYTFVAKRLLDYQINLVGIIREGAVETGFEKLDVNIGDRLVYIGKTRYTWESILEMLISEPNR